MSAVVVAIDGPAASGKSTTARGVARRLGLLYVDSGAMYRALALKVIREGIHVEDVDAIERLLASTGVRLEADGEATRVFLDGEEVTTEIRDEPVGAVASGIAQIRSVRTFLVDQQRLLAEEGGVVMEGRDIGTVVLPRADVKVYLVADTAARSARRRHELALRGIEVPLEEVRRRIEERDHRDLERAESPLRRADDAVTLDTTDLTVVEQVDRVLELIERAADGRRPGVAKTHVHED